MTFNSKIIIFCFILLSTVGFFGVREYQARHPKYVPPPPREEINLTIIPGWNLRQIATDWTEKGIIKSSDELYVRLGEPARNYKSFGRQAPILDLASDPRWSWLFEDKANNVSYEGYLFPDTYRVYKDTNLDDVLKKIFAAAAEKITPAMRDEVKKQGKTWFEIFTMASVVEKEATSPDDMGMVADIFWRRNKTNWALQSCATVNYITGKYDPGISSEDRENKSLYNTYKYPGLPLGPIASPGIKAIQATIFPIKNNYWYFMAGTDGVTRFAKTLEEHNINVARYLR